MKSTKTIILLLTTLLFTGVLPVRAQEVVVDPNTQHQTFEGWGASLAWWANEAGGWSTDKVQNLCWWMAKELNMNVFRFDIGGGDDPAHDHFRTGADLPSYQPSESGGYDWNADANQRRILQQLNAYRDDEIVEAASYSPPYWMTKSGCSAGNTDGSDNLKDNYYDDFADYLTEVVKYYRENYGVTFRTLEPMNEPNVNWWQAFGNQEGCKISVNNQQKLIREVYAKLQSKNMLGYCGISASDANSIDQGVSNINNYVAAGDIMSKLSQINVHSYHGTQRGQLATLASDNNQRLWQSESGPLGVQATGLDNHLVMAQRIVDDIRDMKVSAWVDWQFMSTDDRWGMVTVDYSTQSYYKNKNFHVRRQMSAHIKPGYRIINTNNNNTLAALSPDKSELVIAVVNQSSASSSYTFDLNLFGSVGSTAQVIRTSPNENYKTLATTAISNQRLATTIAARSVTTFVIPVSVNNSFLSEGTYRISPKHAPSKYMSVEGFSSDNGAQIELWSFVNQGNMKFSIDRVGDLYEISPVYNSKVFNVWGNATTNLAKIRLYTDTNTPNARFAIAPVGGGYYKMVAQNSAKVLAVEGNGTSNGTDIVQYQWLNYDNFKWKFEPVSSSSARTSTLPDASPDELYVYPNPTNGELYIDLASGTAGEISVYSLEGKLVEHTEFSAGSGQVSLPITLPEGMYMLNVVTDRETYFQKIIKE